jgi:ribonuclease D
MNMRRGSGGVPRPEASGGPPALYVADARSLEALGAGLRARLENDPRLGLDTEFIRERTYAPVLEIVQVATADGFIALLDVPALGGDLGPVGEVLRDQGVLKILHSGAQDMEILGARLGALPAPVFDTQVAAAFTGFSLQVGYGALVQGLLNVPLSKSEGFADWSRRPLTPGMLAYAEDDVRYLHALHDKLARRLDQLGRSGWAAEQTARALGGIFDEARPEDLWRRVGGRAGLDGRQLAVLRELAVWRDEEARRRDKPRRSVVKDDLLVEVARRLTRSPSEVLALRAAPPNLGERQAAQIAACVERGMNIPPGQRPRSDMAPPLDDTGAVLAELLSAVVRARALDEKLPASLIASTDDLRTLAGTRQRPDFSGPLFSGWRGALVGDALKGVLSGQTAIRWDPAQGRVALTPSAAVNDAG